MGGMGKVARRTLRRYGEHEIVGGAKAVTLLMVLSFLASAEHVYRAP